jgi:hypothetical protein
MDKFLILQLAMMKGSKIKIDKVSKIQPIEQVSKIDKGSKIQTIDEETIMLLLTL